MKLAPRHGRAFLDDLSNGHSTDVLPVEGALALAKAGGARQRMLDLPNGDILPAVSPDEVIHWLNELKPTYRTKPVQRAGRTLLVVTTRD